MYLYLECLDELEDIVVDLFSQVKNKEIELPVWPQHPFNEQHFQTKWYIVPIKHIRSLNIVFPLPDRSAKILQISGNNYFYLSVHCYDCFELFNNVCILFFSFSRHIMSRIC